MAETEGMEGADLGEITVARLTVGEIGEDTFALPGRDRGLRPGPHSERRGRPRLRPSRLIDWLGRTSRLSSI